MRYIVTATFEVETDDYEEVDGDEQGAIDVVEAILFGQDSYRGRIVLTCGEVSDTLDMGED